jgi:hypothetical protein
MKPGMIILTGNINATMEGTIADIEAALSTLTRVGIKECQGRTESPGDRELYLKQPLDPIAAQWNLQRSLD